MATKAIEIANHWLRKNIYFFSNFNPFKFCFLKGKGDNKKSPEIER